jgi:hypothetical protein
MNLEWITSDIVEGWWAAVSATLIAFGSSAWLARQWWIARKAAQLALLVVQIIGRNYVDRWKAENVDEKLTIDQVDWAKNKAVDDLDMMAKQESPAVQAYLKKKTPEALVEAAVKVRKAINAKREKKVKAVKRVGPKGGLR